MILLTDQKVGGSSPFERAKYFFIEKRRAELWGLDQPETHHIQVEPFEPDPNVGDVLRKRLDEMHERQTQLPEMPDR